MLIMIVISMEDNVGFKIGNYGDVDFVEDSFEYEFVVISFDKWIGEEKWCCIVYVGVLCVKCYLKFLYVNLILVIDGCYIVVFFGFEGLFCYDMEGNLVWWCDLGMFDSGWFYDVLY